jgi:hypothetical protein
VLLLDWCFDVEDEDGEAEARGGAKVTQTAAIERCGHEPFEGHEYT